MDQSAVNNLVAHPYFRDWGLLYVLLISLTLSGTGILWITKQKDKEVTRSFLEIKEQLASLFLQTVIDESRKLFKEITKRLPEALSEPKEQESGASRFTYFCKAIKEETLEGEEVNQVSNTQYRLLVKDHLIDIIKTQVENLLHSTEINNELEHDYFTSTSDINFSLQSSTSSKFSFLSEKKAQAELRQRKYKRGSRLGFRFFCSAMIFGSITAIAFFFRPNFLVYIINTGLIITFISIAIGFIFCLRMKISKEWLDSAKERYDSIKELEEEFKKWKVREGDKY